MEGKLAVGPLGVLFWELSVDLGIRQLDRSETTDDRRLPGHKRGHPSSLCVESPLLASSQRLVVSFKLAD